MNKIRTSLSATTAASRWSTQKQNSINSVWLQIWLPVIQCSASQQPKTLSQTTSWRPDWIAPISHTDLALAMKILWHARSSACQLNSRCSWDNWRLWVVCYLLCPDRMEGAKSVAFVRPSVCPSVAYTQRIIREPKGLACQIWKEGCPP